MEIKDRIKEKAEELFDLYSVRSVTMDEIASQLGISKKTIYTCYADKEELVDEVFCNRMKENQQQCICDKATAENAVHEIFLAWEQVSDMLSKMNPSVLYDLEKYHPGVYKKFSDYKFNFLYQMIFSNIERGKKEELYREDINIDVVTKLRLATMMLSFNPALFPGNKYKPVAVEEQILFHFLYGLATPKGLKMIEKYKQQKIKLQSQKI
jgi:TetR/AcrR family transcriptional regulator, cholesterol catabolism regulator